MRDVSKSGGQDGGERSPERGPQYSRTGSDLPVRSQRRWRRPFSGRTVLQSHGPATHKRGDWLDFVWIVYSVFFFIEPFERHNNRYWLQFSIFYVIFVALYVSLVFARKRWQGYLTLIAMGLLGIIYCPHNAGSWGVFVYVAAFIPFISDSVLICTITFALVCITILAEARYMHASPWAWGFAAAFTLIVGVTNLFAATRMRANSKLQLAHEEIEQLAKLAERERIARDLHDVLGHTLSVIVLKSELAGRLFSRDPARAAAEIADVEQISRKALSEVREAIGGYRAEGLTAEISRAQSVLDAAGVELECPGTPPPVLSPAEETVMSLVLREAVTNVVRHAQASRCVMRFLSANGKNALIVEDNGRGGLRVEGNGLRGMRERVESLGGRFSIDGTQGTRLTIEIPARS